jgi:hypothetical protein
MVATHEDHTCFSFKSLFRCPTFHIVESKEWIRPTWRQPLFGARHDEEASCIFKDSNAELKADDLSCLHVKTVELGRVDTDRWPRIDADRAALAFVSLRHPTICCTTRSQHVGARGQNPLEMLRLTLPALHS